MYDNIRLIMPYPFDTEKELKGFIERFALFVSDNHKQIYHNSGYDTLKQNNGIYINLELPSDTRKGKFTLNVSLHKFFNSYNKKGLQNINRFTFKEAQTAFKQLKQFLNINLDYALVKKYEIGINIQTSQSPDNYMHELETIKGLRILEDLHYKEYKQFSTNKEKNKRTVYIYYNKTHEARTKQKKKQSKANIPDNILRIEKDVKRPPKILFYELFKAEFTAIQKQRFKQEFTQKIIYKSYLQKTPNLSYKQAEIIKEIQSKGFDKFLQQTQQNKAKRIITRGQYDYIIRNAKQFKDKNIKLNYIQSDLTKELNELINNELAKI